MRIVVNYLDLLKDKTTLDKDIIIDVLIRQREVTEEEAEEMYDDIMDKVKSGCDFEEVLYEDYGLELSYDLV